MLTRLSTIIEEKIPLKQGLKLSDFFLYVCLFFIEEKIPLKQGLKQIDHLMFAPNCRN